jgi:hypothetical protein
MRADSTLSYTFTFTLSLPLTLIPTITITLTLTLSLAFYRSHSPSLSLSFSLTLTLTLPLPLTHAFSHSLSHFLSPVTAEDRDSKEAVRLWTALVRLFEPLLSGKINRNSREVTLDPSAVLSLRCFEFTR